MTASGASMPVMTGRKERGLKICAREKELLAQRAEFDRERTWIFNETGQKVSGKESQVSEQERAVRSELRALAAERARLLAEITAREAVLRARQSELDKARAALRPGKRKTMPAVTNAERKVRAELALLQSERAPEGSTRLALSVSEEALIGISSVGAAFTIEGWRLFDERRHHQLR